MPDSSSQARQARTGHVAGFDPYGMPTLRPAPSWSVFERRRRRVSPSVPSLTSTVSRPTSSLRRSAPAKPRRRSARSRHPPGSVPSPSTIVRSSGTVTGRTWRWAVPRVLRTPRRTRRTASSLVGLSCPAARWAALMAARRRSIVAGLADFARSATYRATVSAPAGRALTLCSSHQAVNCAQPVR
jgi:hypothetical protein